MPIVVRNIEIPEGLQVLFSADMSMFMPVLVDIAEQARLHWINLADDKLHTTKGEYIDGICDEAALEPGRATLTLEGLIPDIVENGRSEINLRDFLLNGPNAAGKVKLSKTGHKYRPIFFRIMTSEMPASVKRKSKKLLPGEGLKDVSSGSKFKGMVKAGRVYGNFRTISDNVLDGWIRPQTEGVHFAEQVGDFVVKIAPQTFQKFVENLGK